MSSLGLEESVYQNLGRNGFQKYTEIVSDKYTVIKDTAQAALDAAGVDAQDIDAILVGSAFGVGHNIENQCKENTEGFFQYTGMRLQHELGIGSSNIMGLSQMGCITMHSGINLASILLSRDNVNNVLFVAFDAVPEGSSRFVLNSIVSDGCGACIVSKSPGSGFRMIGFNQYSSGYYWDSVNTRDKLATTYYPVTIRIIKKCLSTHNVMLSDIKYIMPNNVSRDSWDIVAGSLKVDIDKVYLKTIEDAGHTVSLDSFLNTKLSIDNNDIEDGDMVLVFGFGFGAHWCAMLMEYCSE